jgi:PAS domain-containing protein
MNAVAAQLAELIKYREAQETVRRSETSLRHIIARNADGMIIMDDDGVVHFVNPAGEALLGRKAEELLDKSFGYPVVAGEKAEIDIVRKDGEATTAEMRSVEIDWNGKRAILASLRDITERKQIEQMKNDFVSLVTSQLRTPGDSKTTIDNGREILQFASAVRKLHDV